MGLVATNLRNEHLIPIWISQQPRRTEPNLANRALPLGITGTRIYAEQTENFDSTIGFLGSMTKHGAEMILVNFQPKLMLAVIGSQELNLTIFPSKYRQPITFQ